MVQCKVCRQANATAYCRIMNHRRRSLVIHTGFRWRYPFQFTTIQTGPQCRWMQGHRMRNQRLCMDRLQSLENLTDQWRDGGSWLSRESLTLFSKQTDRWLCRCSLYGGILRSGYRQVICKSRKLHLEFLPSFPILLPLLLKLDPPHEWIFSQPRMRLFLSPCWRKWSIAFCVFGRTAGQDGASQARWGRPGQMGAARSPRF